MSQNTQNTAVKLEELELDFAPKLIISSNLKREIDWLHNNVDRGKEWCGILFYNVQEGSIQDPNSLVIKAENLYLMDIGSEAYTEADMGSALVDAYIENEVREDMNHGLIHTH